MSPDYQLSTRQKGNPVTQQVHQQEVFRQITLPLAIGVVIILAAAVAVVVSAGRGVGDVGAWADVSLIWLIVPGMVFVFILLALTAGVAYAVTRLLGVVPSFARQVQDFFLLVQYRVEKIADTAAEPVLRLGAVKASWRSLWRKFR
jgi:hypothetical protein